ncbi:methyl-accepting chemotaxis protein [Paenibacillus hunanensis]|uniref:methyl-accepting chemotaxis protein n=1 Tax=Paenibacillus hunanensis TaxID=539262 RepID=UPI0020274CC2|nr:methyl-accepting chemotaxis protein [Paenibacillus hunanensis]MCL9662889.1 methyl-accepting chemotaxis protein [Paenibacillus hunanensis]
MKWTILQKLLASFLLIALIAGGAGVIYIHSLDKIHDSTDHIFDQYAVLKSEADNLKFYATVQNSNMLTYMLSRDSYYGSELLTANQQTSNLLNSMKSKVTDTKSLQQIDYLLKMNDYYKSGSERLIQMTPAEVSNAYLDIKTSLIPMGGVLVKFAQQFSDEQDSLMTAAREQTEQTIINTRLTAIIVTVLNLVLAILIGALVSRIISKPLRLLSSNAKQIANGELNIADVQVKQRDEIGQLAESFNLMKNNLRELVQEINGNTDQVITISREVASGTSETSKAAEHVAGIMYELSSNTGGQVSTVENGLKSIYDISSNIHQIDENSQQARDIAIQAQTESLKGEQEIQRVTVQMQAIQTRMGQIEQVIHSLGKRSEEIEEINNAISSIATQTNLLSLNAAIEAARAGEHGRGFAVVTSEIRKLSNETNESAVRIRNLVQAIQSETGKAGQSVHDMVEEVYQGTAAAGSVNELFHTIKQLTDRTTQQIGSVTDELQHLNGNSGKVVQSMEYISTTTGNIASGTESVSAAAEEQLAFLEQSAAHTATLHHMAEKLQQAVARFKLD